LEHADRLVLVASKGGAPRHPAWLHNLCANPEVRFRWKGHNERRRARVADAGERADLWPRLLDLYPGYEVYQRRAGGRQIPLVILEKVPA
jgi:deazaflavin-dependent oxidoreductase (nitroreductase family)